MKAKSTGMRVQQAVAVFLSMALFCAIGCKNFFTPIDGTGSTVTNTGDYAYVVSSNTTSSTDPIYTLSGFSIGTDTLTELNAFPLTLPFAPETLAINPANSILYVAGLQVIYGYTISSSGALTSILNASQTQALANASIVSMAVSPDGQWLLALDLNETLVTIDEFQIGSNGLLTLETGAQYQLKSGNPIVASSISISPKGDYVAAAVGTGGVVLFSFATSTGALSPVYEAYASSTSSADQAVAFDSAEATLYVARSGTNGGVVPYTIGNGGVLTQVSGTPVAVGNDPSSILIDSTGKYLYVGNKGDNTISGFSIASGGVLTALSGSPYTSGMNVSDLGSDNSGKYVLATALDGSPDMTMYSFDTTTAGKLDPVRTASTGDPTEPAVAVAVALTH